MGLSIGAFAKRVGVSHEAIRKGIKSGRVVLSSDGTIDEMTQVERWHATRDPSKVRGGRPMTASTPEASASAHSLATSRPGSCVRSSRGRPSASRQLTTGTRASGPPSSAGGASATIRPPASTPTRSASRAASSR